MDVVVAGPCLLLPEFAFLQTRLVEALLTMTGYVFDIVPKSYDPLG